MPAFTASAPGKIILFGEHAVVYGQPAIAVPIPSLQARAIISPDLAGPSGRIQLDAPDIGLTGLAEDLPKGHHLRAALDQVLGDLPVQNIPACQIRLSSTIPPSSGLGSGTAISTSLIRAFSAFLGQRLSDEQISAMVFEVEKIHHGTPSGIDNSVISFQKPVYFRQGDGIRFLNIPTPFSILVINSGNAGDTLRAVMELRQAWENDPEPYNRIFKQIGKISELARQHIENGKIVELGPLIDQNHQLLVDLGVSTPKLDKLVTAAREAGVLGAKLSGGGLGGHLIALVEDHPGSILEALINAGAASAFVFQVAANP